MNSEPLQQTCTVCGKSVMDNCFARIHEGNEWIFLCSPKCVVSHFGDHSGLPPTDNVRSGKDELLHGWYDLDASFSEDR